MVNVYWQIEYATFSEFVSNNFINQKYIFGLLLLRTH